MGGKKRRVKEETKRPTRTRKSGKKSSDGKTNFCINPLHLHQFLSTNIRSSLPSVTGGSNIHSSLPSVTGGSNITQENLQLWNLKWCSKELTKTNVFNRQQFNNINSPTLDEPLPNLGDDPVASEGVNSDDVVRPQGRKGCKEKKRKLNEEKCRKPKKLRERAQRRQEQERIMNQDLSKLSPTVRASYEIFQGQILKEWEIEGLFGNDMNNMEQGSNICQDGEEVEQSVPAQVAMQIHEKYWAIWM
ncbi:NAM-associated domain-containing protein [Forsythia ovata]|uniref:NAM-associated domain-containing protein n=1 Tax=Forsythia ovata TaxID=205694 RepID=A0ABD1W2I9_9LAMI